MDLQYPSGAYGSSKLSTDKNVENSYDTYTCAGTDESNSALRMIDYGSQPLPNFGMFGVSISETSPLRYPSAMSTSQSWMGAVKPITASPSHNAMLQSWYDDYDSINFPDSRPHEGDRILREMSTEINTANLRAGHQLIPSIADYPIYEPSCHPLSSLPGVDTGIPSAPLSTQGYTPEFHDIHPVEESSVDSLSQRREDSVLPPDLLFPPKIILPSSYAGSEISESVVEIAPGTDANIPRRRGEKTGKVRSKSRKILKKIPGENTVPECIICGKTFERFYNYKSHLQTHDPERLQPFLCDYESCKAKFTRKAELERHKQSV